MNKNTLSQGEPWMTPEERELNHRFVHATTQRLAARGIPETPLLMIRVNDVIATWLLARRLESALAPVPGEPAPCPTPAQAGAIGKCRDRLRRAMKELEACCPRDTAPAGQGLFERMRQVTQKTSETSPDDETPNQHATHPAENTDDNKTNETQSPDSAEQKLPKPNQTPETVYHDPNPPLDAPNEQSPLLNRAARRRQAREERHNRKGRRLYPKSSCTPQGPGRRTTAGQRDS